jgi:hypothetical protein
MSTVRVAAVWVLLALPVADTAYAECAWVLWQERRTAGTSWQARRFFVEQAFTTRDECEKRRWSAGAIAGNDNKAKGAGRVPDDGIRRSYQCLPDTIDPRGPQSSRREP